MIPQRTAALFLILAAAAQTAVANAPPYSRTTAGVTASHAHGNAAQAAARTVMHRSGNGGRAAQTAPQSVQHSSGNGGRAAQGGKSGTSPAPNSRRVRSMKKPRPPNPVRKPRKPY